MRTANRNPPKTRTALQRSCKRLPEGCFLSIRKLFFQGRFRAWGSHRITHISAPDQNHKINVFPDTFRLAARPGS